MPTPLTPQVIEGFIETFLHETFDDPVAPGNFHRECWKLFCDPARYVAISAPRGHSKSTSLTLSCTLASIMFGVSNYALLLGASEDVIKPHIQNLLFQLQENEALIDTFKVTLKTVNQTELEGTTLAGPFRIIGKAPGQKIRGILWKARRPDLVIGDDLEDDIEVLNKESRVKLMKWLKRTILPIGSPRTKFRIFGTILHMDSLLENLLQSETWKTRRFSAHRDFDDFRDILWPERFNERALREIRQQYIEDHDPSGYSQEYLSRPIAETDAYFQKHMFLPMSQSDMFKPMNYYIAVDFAISQAETADCTVMLVAGVTADNMINVVQVDVFRGDGEEIIENLFTLAERYRDAVFILEEGQIRKSLGAFINTRMREHNTFLDIVLVKPLRDKISRSRSIQKRMQHGAVRFDTEASWYPGFLAECLAFPRGKHDDQVDALAWLGLHLDKLLLAPTVEELQEEEYAAEQKQANVQESGRSSVTGY